MAFAIARIKKLKGGSIAASDSHNARTRETPNADPEQRNRNRVLIGDDSPVSEAVQRIIRESGGKPRRDSVEGVEMVFTTSREFFENERGEIDMVKVELFAASTVKFLQDTSLVGRCVKAVLHMDERTPHIQALCVPIDENGRLNCKRFFGSRAKLSAFQDAFHEKVKDLGLERGVRGSRAKHTDIKKFYAAVLEDSRIAIDRDRLPDPPRVLVTRQGIDEYKGRVIEMVHEQLEKPLRVLRHQAMLTREERNKREAAERRAAERVVAVEAQAAERISAAERVAQEALARHELEVQRNAALQNRNAGLELSNDRLIKEVVTERGKNTELSITVQRLRDQVTDIPLIEVLQRLGYRGEPHSQTHLYRNGEGRVTLMVAGNTLYDHERRLLCSNALDSVLHIRNVHEGGEITREQALAWLADNFGAGRAAAAYLAERQQAVTALFTERNRARDRDRDSAREPSRQRNHSYSRGR